MCVRVCMSVSVTRAGCFLLLLRHCTHVAILLAVEPLLEYPPLPTDTSITAARLSVACQRPKKGKKQQQQEAVHEAVMPVTSSNFFEAQLSIPLTVRHASCVAGLFSVVCLSVSVPVL